MSRICVKNLPKYINEDRLREFFSQKGEVTDAKLMRTTDGKSRQFGFIGYRTEQEAEEAITYFNKSYLDTCRIICEVARKVGDPNTPRPWSRYSKEKEEKVTEEKNKASSGKGLGKNKHNDEKSNIDNDPKLEEFLKVMQPRSKSKLWEDDSLVGPDSDKNGKMNKQLTQVNIDGLETLVKVDRNGSSHVKNVLDDHTADKLQSPAHNEAVTDMDYFKSRVKKDWSDSESSDDEYDSDDSNQNVRGGQDLEDEDQTSQHNHMERGLLEVHSSKEFDSELIETGSPSSSIENVADDDSATGRLFVRNLPYSATEEEIEEIFSKYGNVSEVHLVVDKDTKHSKGFAYVHYSVAEAAARALQDLDHSIFQGRLLHVMPAKAKLPSENQQTSNTVNAKTFKQKREQERKASEASGNTQSWNSLFMRPDTVVENIARKYGVSKTEFLDREAGDLAVRIALGETQIIAETKAALTNAGVNVQSLEDFASGNTEGKKRSNHVLLVKNLPYSSTDAELSEMFGKFGTLDKIILPPTRTLSLVVFLEPAEARAAFRGLAYKRYKDAPLYLEWAPSNILSQVKESVVDERSKIIVGENEVKKAKLEQIVRGTSDVDIDPDRIESRSLFVKNLNFKTIDETLKKHISVNMKGGSILSVRIKKHLKNGKTVSMGFGFVEFDSPDTAANVCRDLQGTVLDGHALILQLCHSKKNDKTVNRTESDRSSTKLIVRNVAFEATEKDLRQLFSPFGQIKRLRLPMRFGNHRGFAFVEFVTKQEAQNALEALSNTHLYGRHLVLERAKEGETLEELRARTAAQFADDQNGSNSSTKVSKKRKHMTVLDEGSFKFERIMD